MAENAACNDERCDSILIHRMFRVQVVFDDEVMGEGEGRSKKEAEQAAAQDALLLIESARKAREAAQEHL